VKLSVKEELRGSKAGAPAFCRLQKRRVLLFFRSARSLSYFFRRDVSRGAGNCQSVAPFGATNSAGLLLAPTAEKRSARLRPAPLLAPDKGR